MRIRRLGRPGTTVHLVDPLSDSYRLGVGSPAENAGINSPAGGVGVVDGDGGLRIIDGVVDVGAYEGVELLFSDTLERGITSRWSSTTY